MLTLAQLEAAANAKKDENMAFRVFLKSNADPEELDKQFRALHDELFAAYDCCKCNNCCRIYAIALREDEADAIADFLGLSTADFAEKYLFRSSVGGYGIESPCPFLHRDGKCVIHACKPSVCQGYPYTDQPDRMGSLINIVSITEECPIVFELVERLKGIYSFSTGRGIKPDTDP